MLISGVQLVSQVDRVISDWPWLTQVNDSHGLPPWLLHAVGSRETNLTNEVGDGGHGHGVWQLDDRFHHIPAGFDQDVRAQAEIAAAMIAGLHSAHGDWEKALNAYNSGSPDVRQTAGHNYGPDVMDRRAFIVDQHGQPGGGAIPAMEYGQTSNDVRTLQANLNRLFPAYSSLPVTGFYGDMTTAVVKEFQRRAGVPSGDGRNVGPQTAAALSRFGYQP